MKESVLHYVWQQKLFKAADIKSTDGENLEIIDPGKLNSDAGPDFFNAKIKIDGTVWAGNIEMHLKASDWNEHGHDKNKVYDSTILHVVTVADKEIYRTNGEKIPQLILEFPDEIWQNYEKLLQEVKWIPCEDKITQVPNIFIENWKSALVSERLEQRTTAILQLLTDNNNHWEEAFYITLARAFGFGKNSEAFELLARSTPLSTLGKHKNSLFQIEALLFGQAGLLNDYDDYACKLKKEYDFLRSKFDLQEMDHTQWRLLRLRPDNFPHVRIAQFAGLIHSSSKLFSKIIEKPEIEHLQLLFKCEPSAYWKSHYLFGHQSSKKEKHLGISSINSLIINTVVPFVFCYANQKQQQELKDKALQLLEKIPAENNAIIKHWSSLKLDIASSWDTQALLHLKKQYCDDKKCLRCRIGHKVLTMRSQLK